jgi:hypothetical protein
MSAPRSALKAWPVLCAACSIGATPALAVIYNDSTADQAGTNTSEVDIRSVEVTNDATNISFKINLVGDISTANFGNYHIGFDTGAGGSTTVAVPWGQVFGMSSGMDYWVGSWVNFGGGSELDQWNGSGWTNNGAQTVTLTNTSTTITVPLSALGLSNGSTFKFDVWSTYGAPGGQSAYDALSNPNLAVADPWNGGPYDSSTAGPGGTPLVSMYTVSTTSVSSWNVDADGNWSNPANWNGGNVPNSVGAAASFGTIITANRTVTVDAPQMVGTISFDNTHSYTIAGTNTLTLDVTSGQAEIDVLNGSHTISAPITLNKDTTINVIPAASTLSLTGTLTATGRTISKTGSGAVQVANLRAAGLTVNAGTVQVLANGTNAGASEIGTLSIAGGATPTAALDLNDNDLVVSNTTSSVVTGAIAFARHGGAWDRPGLTSSAARTQTNHATTLGVLSAAEYNSVGGTGSFSGQPYTTGDVLVKYTWYGDTDLNGKVNFDDYVRTDNGFNNHLTGWLNGDFDGNGQVNFDDYVLIDLAFNTQSGTLGRALGLIEGRGSAAGDPALQQVQQHLQTFGSDYGQHLLSAVPEPIGLAVLGFVPILVRRRRR